MRNTLTGFVKVHMKCLIFCILPCPIVPLCLVLLSAKHSKTIKFYTLNTFEEYKNYSDWSPLSLSLKYLFTTVRVVQFSLHLNTNPKSCITRDNGLGTLLCCSVIITSTSKYYQVIQSMFMVMTLPQKY